MFGIELGRQARSLRDEVKMLYGREVLEIGPLATESHHEADSGVAPDGAPYVRVRSGVTLSEELIVHELFHLKLTATGFPYVLTVSPRSFPQNELCDLHFFVAETYDLIEHTIFYPRMRDMGIQPDGRHRRDVRLAMTYGYRYGEKLRGALQALYLSQATLLIDDAELLALFKRYYRSNDWNDALTVSGKLVDLINADRPSTPEAAVTTLLGCLDVMRLGGATFGFAGSETRAYGGSRVQVVYIGYQLGGC